MSAFQDDAWRRVGDAVLRGLNHSLANRVTALAALTASTFPDEPPGEELVASMATEVERLEAVLRLLRLLPDAAGAAGAAAELVLPADALADAQALHAHHTGLADALCRVEGDPAALLPVVAPLPGLVHALVLLLGAVALHARGAHGAPPPVLRVSGSERAVRLAGAAGAAVGAAGDGAPDPASVVAGLRRLLDGAAATVAYEAGLVVVELPTVLARRAAAAGGTA